MSTKEATKCYLHPEGHQEGSRMWEVSAKGQTWEVGAHCQLEAWDSCLLDKDGRWFADNCGLIVLAKPAEASDDEQIAIHTCGLLVRYGYLDLAQLFDEVGEEHIGSRVLDDIYRSRGVTWVHPSLSRRGETR